jgi:hypothetical protein
MPIAFYDTECFPNYWLLKMKLASGNYYASCIGAGESLSSYQRDNILQYFSEYTTVSFNGIRYDVPMIAAALAGYTCEQLKWLNDQLIVHKAKPWELGIPEWKPADHIDIMEVLPGMGGQKMYAGRIHCKTMRDLPYSPDQTLTPAEIIQVDDYCGNDLTVLEALYDAVQPQLSQRVELGKRYGLDLRSKSDAQLAEAVLKLRCEQALGRRIYKKDVNYDLRFKYEAPAWVSFITPALVHAFGLVKAAVFGIGSSGYVDMPSQLKELQIPIGSSVYRMGIGGLHSSEKSVAHVCALRDIDVASYYPSLILNSGKYPAAMGPAFLREYSAIKEERLVAKKREKTLTKGTPEWTKAHVENEGGKIMINGTFGKLGSPYSVLFAPEMLIQTTVTGQLALLMLIENLEHRGVTVVSGNTDGIVAIDNPIIDTVVKAWERTTGLETESASYTKLYSRDVNNYLAYKVDGSVKRKGEFARADLVAKKSPDLEICGDAVAEFLGKGTPLAKTITECRDIRKFITIQKVAGGAVKLWGEGPQADLVRDMVPVLLANGWEKCGRKWVYESRGQGSADILADARTAYVNCFSPQRPEYLGKVIRWYYSREAPGPIIYNTNGNHVPLSYGAKPCMALPDEFPGDVDYDWYLRKCNEMLKEVGYAG